MRLSSINWYKKYAPSKFDAHLKSEIKQKKPEKPENLNLKFWHLHILVARCDILQKNQNERYLSSLLVWNDLAGDVTLDWGRRDNAEWTWQRHGKGDPFGTRHHRRNTLLWWHFCLACSSRGLPPYTPLIEGYCYCYCCAKWLSCVTVHQCHSAVHGWLRLSSSDPGLPWWISLQHCTFVAHFFQATFFQDLTDCPMTNVLGVSASWYNFLFDLSKWNESSNSMKTYQTNTWRWSNFFNFF